MCTTLMMSTGPGFGSMSALFGLTNHMIDQVQYTIRHRQCPPLSHKFGSRRNLSRWRKTHSSLLLTQYSGCSPVHQRVMLRWGESQTEHRRPFVATCDGRHLLRDRQEAMRRQQGQLSIAALTRSRWSPDDDEAQAETVNVFCTITSALSVRLPEPSTSERKL
jgi:hypothetical protein